MKLNPVTEMYDGDQSDYICELSNDCEHLCFMWQISVEKLEKLLKEKEKHPVYINKYYLKIIKIAQQYLRGKYTLCQ